MNRRIALVVGFALAISVAVSAISPSDALAQRPGNPQKYHGKTLSEWMTLYWTWNISGGPDRIGNVKFMPLPVGEVVQGSGSLDDPLVVEGFLEVSHPRNTAFVMGIAAWIGETYDPELGIPDDTPLDSELFLNSNVLITMDGKKVIDSSQGSLYKFYYGPTDFVPPLIYDTPTDYGAIGAIWSQGLGMVHPPLPRGVHRMLLTSELRLPDFDLHVIFHNEWRIVVD